MINVMVPSLNEILADMLLRWEKTNGYALKNILLTNQKMDDIMNKPDLCKKKLKEVFHVEQLKKKELKKLPY